MTIKKPRYPIRIECFRRHWWAANPHEFDVIVAALMVGHWQALGAYRSKEFATWKASR